MTMNLELELLGDNIPLSEDRESNPGKFALQANAVPLCHPRTLINNKIKKTLYLNILIGTNLGQD